MFLLGAFVRAARRAEAARLLGVGPMLIRKP
jgi:hypothetical protein